MPSAPDEVKRPAQRDEPEGKRERPMTHAVEGDAVEGVRLIYSPFFGRPRGRTVDSKPSRAAVRLSHESRPYGTPRRTQRRNDSISAAVCGWFTSERQLRERSTGHAEMSAFDSASPRSRRHRLPHCQSYRRTRIRPIEGKIRQSARRVSRGSWHDGKDSSPPWPVQ